MGFRDNLCRESVRSLPLREAVCVDRHTLVRAAIARMRATSLGCVVIVDCSGAPIGIFTEKSVITILSQGADLDEYGVADFADPHFAAVKITAPILQVWELVRSSAVRFVCVVDENGSLIGVTGQRGLSEYLADCFAPQITVQRLDCKPWLQQREGA